MIRIIKQSLSFAATLFIPLLYLQTLIVINATAHNVSFSPEIIIIGVILAIIGLLLWIGSFIALGSSFGVLPQKQKRITRGLYRYFKHPMYIGIILTFLGLSISLESIKGILFILIVIAPVLIIRAYYEEKTLQ